MTACPSVHEAAAAAAPPQLAVVEQAIDWLVRLQSGSAGPADWEACRHWQAARPEHALAWARVQGIQNRFAGLPGEASSATFEQARRDLTRRKALRLFGLACGTGTLALLAPDLLPTERLLADYSTGTGERRLLRLADGSTLWLDTASAVSIDFDTESRHIRLRQGRILLTTGTDPGAVSFRPVTVGTRDGLVRALGTRFMVQRAAEATEVQVLQHAVELRPSKATAPQRVLQAGEQGRFDADGVLEVGVRAPDADAWIDGVLVARDMRLADFTHELGRYRPGRLACDAAVAELRISGVFSLQDTEQALALLARTLPLRIERRTRYWVSLRAR